MFGAFSVPRSPRSVRMSHHCTNVREVFNATLASSARVWFTRGDHAGRRPGRADGSSRSGNTLVHAADDRTLPGLGARERCADLTRRLAPRLYAATCEPARRQMGIGVV